MITETASSHSFVFHLLNFPSAAKPDTTHLSYSGETVCRKVYEHSCWWRQENPMGCNLESAFTFWFSLCLDYAQTDVTHSH